MENYVKLNAPLPASINEQNKEKVAITNYVKEKTFSKLINLKYYDFTTIKYGKNEYKPLSVKEIKKENGKLMITYTKNGKDIIDKFYGRPEVFRNDTNTTNNKEEIKKCITNIKDEFDNNNIPIQTNDKYVLEHVLISENDVILTYKNSTNKIKIIIKDENNIEIKREARDSTTGIRGFFSKKWFSGGKSRRNKKIAKKRHTKKRRN